MKKRIISALVAASVIFGMLPGVLAENIAAVMENALSTKSTVELQSTSRASESSKKNIDEQAYSELGFNTNVEEDNNSFFGVKNKVLVPKKELFFNVHGSSNTGRLLRKGLDFSNKGAGLKEAGAYKLYGQYRNGGWAHLDDKNGYNNGQTGGDSTVVWSDIKSDNMHYLRAYEKSVAFNSGSGRDSNVATVSLGTVDEHRQNQRFILEITNFTNDGKQVSSRRNIIIKNVGSDSAFNEAGKTWAYDHSAIIDITAGDYNGDGVDELAVYCGDNTVRIYKTKSDRKVSLVQTIDIASLPYEYTGDKIDGEIPMVKRAMSVTLQTFDLNQNNADELVITASCPNLGENKDKCTSDKYKAVSNTYIYGCDSRELKLKEQAKIPLYDSNYILKAANSAAADFTGNGRKMLVLGGRASDVSTLNEADKRDDLQERIGYVTVTYNHNDKKYEVGVIQIVNQIGDYNTKLFNNRNKYNVPVAMDAFNMYGTAKDNVEPTRLFLFDRTYKYNKETGNFEDIDVKLHFSDGQKNNADEGVGKSETWISDIVVGNFTGKDIGNREQLVAVVGQKQNNDDKYWYSIAYISADESGNHVCNWEGVINQGTGYYNRSDREGSFLALSAPDVDNDSMFLEYKSSETYLTKPEVQAVMQSPPYFEDVADVHDDYLNNGATAYGKTSSSTKGATASVEASLGVYVSTEISFFASAEFESSVKATASYDHQTSWTKSTEIEYAGGVGDDYVVMYTIPYHRYIYDSTDPKGKKGTFIIDEPMEPVTVLVTVDKYDEIASQYNGLEPIRGNILTSKAGDPVSYKDGIKGKFTNVGNLQLLTNAGKGGSTLTVSESNEKETENSFSVGVEENLKMGVGAGMFGSGATAGVEQSFAVAGGGVFSNMNGVTYTGTVDNLPDGVTDFRFNWQFGHSTVKLNGEDVVVIGYKTSNISNPPSVPKNIAITDIEKNAMTIEWDETPEAAIYELYFITPEGDELPLANVPGTMAKNGMVSYQVKNLDPATGYTFAVKASDAYGIRSMSSPQVTGTTLSDGNEQFSITKQPQDEEAAVGETATFEISASGSSSDPIQYQWYKYNAEDKAWDKTGQNLSKLQFTATDELDGSRYYCIVYQGTRVLKSKSVKLKIGLSDSTTDFEVSKGNSKLQDNDFVQSKYIGYEDKTDTREVWKTATKVVDGKTYTKLALSEQEIEVGEDISYTYTEPYLWMYSEKDATDGTTVKYYKDNNGPDTTTEYPVTTKYTFGKEDDDSNTVAETSSDKSTIAEVDINGTKTTEAYLITGTTDEYIYICKDAEDVTTYYKKNGDKYDKYNFQIQTDTISVDGIVLEPNTLVEVKEKGTEEYTYKAEVNNPGETIKLTANVEKKNGDPITNGRMSFRIIDRSTGVASVVNGTYDSNKKQWTAEHTFFGVGIYDITAAYGGTSTYKSSVSDQISLNAYLPDITRLSINGGNMVYGDSFVLNPVLIDGKTKQNANPVSYTVKKYESNNWKVVSGLITNDSFNPNSIGKYQITASYNNNGTELTTTTSVNVSARTVTVTPNDTEQSVNSSETERRAAVTVDIVGAVTEDDENSIKNNITVSSDAFTKRSKGDYQINVNVNQASSYSDKYTFVNKTAIFSLKEKTVKVEVNAGANGSAYISYVTKKLDAEGNYAGDSPSLTVDSGSLVPTGANVTFTANPNPGFGVNKWTNVPAGVKDPGKDNTLTVENIQGNAEVGVTFSYALNSVYFNAVDESGGAVSADVGTVSGAYAGGNTFNSGDTLPIGTSITLTATPGERYVLSGWMEYDGSNWKYIKGADGVSNDTSLTYTISNVTSSKNIRAVFALKDTKTVTFKVVDGDNNVITSADIYVNGEKVTNNEYQAYKHQTLKVEVKAPSSVLIESWSLNDKNVSGKSESYTIYDLTDNANIVIHCQTPNTRTITFGAQRADNQALDTEHTYITAKRVGGTDNIESGSQQPQGVELEFTANPQDGFRVQKWLLNGNEVLGVDNQTYKFTLDGNSDVKVVYEKKPVVTIDNDSNLGTVTANVGETNIANGKYVEFGDDVRFTIVPKNGYVIDKATLNGSEVELSVGTADTDIRFYVANDVNADITFKVTYTAKPKVNTDYNSEQGSVEVKAKADFAEKVIASGDYVDFDSTLNITVDPKEGYIVDKILANDVSVTFDRANNTDNVTAKVENVNVDTTIKVTFKLKPIITTDFEVAKGTVTVNGTADFAQKEIVSGAYVDFDSTASVTINPGTGYVVDTVSVNNTATEFSTADRSDVATVTINNINENQNIKVTFKYKPVITLASVSNGSVTLTGTADFDEKEIESSGYVDFDSTLTITATPNSGYVIDYIKANGTVIGYTSAGENTDKVTATIEHINENKNIEVVFKAKPIITITNDADKGSITVKGMSDFIEKEITTGDYVDFDSKLTIDVKPVKGTVVDKVLVDGQEAQFNIPENSDDISVIVSKVSKDTAVAIEYRDLGVYTLNYEVINTEDGAENAEHGVLNVKSSRKDMESYKTEDTDKINGNVTVYEGGEIILDAKGDKEWRVKEWTVDGVVDEETGGTMTLTAEKVNQMSDKTVKVQFIAGRGRLTFVAPENAQLTASITGKDFTSGGFPEVGAVVNFALEPDEHYVLKHWMLNGQVLDDVTDLTYDFTADENDATVAAEVQKEQLNITATTDGNGTAEGLPEVVRHGDTVTITAIAAYGYDFDGWYVNNKKIEGAGEVYTFVAEEALDYVAKFTLKPRSVVNFAVNNKEWGAISAAANGRGFASGVKVMSSCTIVFTVAPADGYRVKSWSGLPQDSIIADDKLTATISALDGDVDVTVELEKIPVYQITYTDMANGKVVATVNGGAVTEVREGTEVTFTAIPSEGWMFKKWTNDAASFTEAEFKLTINKDVLVGAEFISGMYYNVKYDIADGTTGGTVSGTADETTITKGVEVQHRGGSTIKFVATPENGKMVKSWAVNGKELSELSNTLTFALTENVDVKVEFEDLVLYDIPADTEDYTLMDIVKVPADYGAERTIRGRGNAEFKVVPKDGKTITKFEVPTACGEKVETIRNNDGTYNVKVNGVKQNITIVYSTEEGIPLTIEKTVNGTVYVKNRNHEILGSGSAVKARDTLEVVATPDSGYKVSQITINGSVSKSGVYSVKDDDTAVVVSVVFVKRSSGSGGGGGGGGSLAGASYNVGFESNGGTVVAAVKVSANTALAKPADPTKDGFVFDGWYTDKELTQKYDFSEKVTKNFTLYAKWNEKSNSTCSGGDGCSIAKFTDVNLAEWYHEDIEYVYDNKLMKGIEEFKFGPDDSLTRAMLVTVLYRAEGEPAVNRSIPFGDLDMSDYYADAVIWAHQNEIVKGVTENEFDPNGNITREQIAAIIFRYAKYKGIAPEGAWAIKLDYADLSEVSDYAVEAVMYCKVAGIMQGKEDNKFGPQDNATRAEVSAILHRFIESNKA